MTVAHLFSPEPVLFRDLCIGVNRLEFHLERGKVMNSAFAELMERAIEHHFVAFYGSQRPGIVICEFVRGRGSAAQAVLGLLNFLRLQQNLAPLNEWVIAEMAGVRSGYKSDEGAFEQWVTALGQCLIDAVNKLC